MISSGISLYSTLALKIFLIGTEDTNIESTCVRGIDIKDTSST